mgnify:CR=1 FL=1
MNKKKTKKKSKIIRGGNNDLNQFLQQWCKELIYPKTDGTIEKI